MTGSLLKGLSNQGTEKCVTFFWLMKIHFDKRSCCIEAVCEFSQSHSLQLKCHSVYLKEHIGVKKHWLTLPGVFCKNAGGVSKRTCVLSLRYKRREDETEKKIGGHRGHCFRTV